MTHTGKDYLVALDYLSKFPEIALLERKTAVCVIMPLESMFARHGIADHLMSNNMPFASCEFQAFAKERRVKLTDYFESDVCPVERASREICFCGETNVAQSRRGRPGSLYHVTSVPQHSRGRNVIDRRPDGRWFESHLGKNFSIRNFGNSVYPALPVVFQMRQ